MQTTSFLLFFAALSAGCAATPSSTPAEALFADARFAPPTERIHTDDVFAVSPAMKRFLAVDIAQALRIQGPQEGLIDALYRPGLLKLEYDAATTKTAAQAFETRSGNCLALVLMTAAFAKELKLAVYYQSATVDASWSRSGNLLLANGHVNITLAPRPLGSATRDLRRTTIDFLPPEDLRGLRTREIEEATVVAMYANNRAAEALGAGRLDDAYAWGREALRVDPGFLAAYNTLGVVYRQHGDQAEADRAFTFVLSRDPKNTRALANLAESYVRQGRGDEAATLRARLAEVEAYPPFHFFDFGREAMRRNDYRAARDYFAREVARADYNHEFHFWLGLADWQLGNVDAARKQLQLALDHSTTRGQQNLYAAKLSWLRAQGTPQ